MMPEIDDPARADDLARWIGRKKNPWINNETNEALDMSARADRVLLDRIERLEALIKPTPATDIVLPSNHDQPWPTRQAIERLVDFVGDCFDKNYDGHGWEELHTAAIVVRKALAGIPSEGAESQ